MNIHRRRGWEIPESQATPESAMLGRRAALAGLAAGIGATASTPASAQWSLFGSSTPPAPPLKLAPLEATRNDRYKPGRDITAETDATSYNNFYEFGTSKSVWGAARKLVSDPWSVEIAGMVPKPRKIAIEDLLKQVALEERVYRHRCVETWAMTVPWVGFPMSRLVALAEPLSSAKYLVFTTLMDAKTMPGLSQVFYPWPYTEGVTIEEAANELSFFSVGMYGKVLPPQNGAPLRVTLPWKYGFKSAKSIIKITFTDKRPVSFWEGLQDNEYGFWANVNPEVPHPRWSQASETVLGSNTRVPTKIWNGYGEFVAAMYADKKGERLFA